MVDKCSLCDIPLTDSDQYFQSNTKAKVCSFCMEEMCNHNKKLSQFKGDRNNEK